jgi:hypothetical protein
MMRLTPGLKAGVSEAHGIVGVDNFKYPCLFGILHFYFCNLFVMFTPTTGECFIDFWDFRNL